MRLRHLGMWGVGGWMLAASAALTLGLPITVASADEPADNPYFASGAEPGSGVGKRIGYISLGEDVPFAHRVTMGIIEQAAVAGVDLLVCDSKVDFDETIACAQQLASGDVLGVLNFQVWEGGAPDICAAYGSLPTIAIDIHQRPCEVAFVGVDNHKAGLLVGTAMGEHLRRTQDCRYDSVDRAPVRGYGLDDGGAHGGRHRRIRGDLRPDP